MLSRMRTETVARTTVREWARRVGLPASVTGPIRPSVQLAYDAALGGATDDEAKKVYERAEVARLAKNDIKRDEKWTSAAQVERRKELAPLRKWAKDNGVELPKNGLIPLSVTEAYEAARAGQPLKRRPSKQPKRNGS
jgi:hypothetical protein